MYVYSIKVTSALCISEMLMLLLKINCLMKYVVTLIIKMSLNFGNRGMLNSVKMSIRMLTLMVEQMMLELPMNLLNTFVVYIVALVRTARLLTILCLIESKESMIAPSRITHV